MPDLADQTATDSGVPDPDSGVAGQEWAGPGSSESSQEWSGPSKEEWDTYVSVLGALAGYAPVLDQLGRLASGYGQTNGPPVAGMGDLDLDGDEGNELDPFDPDSVDEHIEQRVNQLVANRLAPLEQMAAMYQVQTGQQIAQQMLKELEGQIGSFDHARAQAMAASLTSMGYNPRVALYMAAQSQAQFERDLAQKAAADAVAEWKQKLEAAGSAPREPGVSAASNGEIVGMPSGRGWGKQLARLTA